MKGSPPQPVAYTHVQIQILDVNDNYPVFDADSPHVLAVDRLTPPGTVLTLFRSTDADEGRLGEVAFRLENADGLFDLDGKSGALALAKALPLEDGREIVHLEVAALDGGRPALKTIHKVWRIFN